MVDPVSRANAPQQIQESNTPARAAHPAGVAEMGSSIESQNEGRRFSSIRNFFSKVTMKIKNALKRFFYLIFFCFKPKVTEKSNLISVQTKLDRVDHISKELALLESKESLIVYVNLGKEVFAKSYNVFWKSWVTFVPFLGRKTFEAIGKEAALKDYKLTIPHLKDFYQSELQTIRNRIRIEQEAAAEN